MHHDITKNPFLAQIYTVINQIPHGKISTYGDVARMAGYPGYARQVGRALGQLPDNTQLPWHRVINSRGTVSLSGADLTRQQQALLFEGIVISANGRISLEKYRWNPKQG